MTTIDRDEFTAQMNLLHKKLDKNKDHFSEKMETMNEGLVELRTEVRMNPVKPRPCEFFKDHEREHKKLQFVVIKSVIGAIATAIVTALGTVFMFKNGGNQ
jgi:hypothetical protein